MLHCVMLAESIHPEESLTSLPHTLTQRERERKNCNSYTERRKRKERERAQWENVGETLF